MGDVARPMLEKVLAALTGVGGWDRCGSVCIKPEGATRDYGGSVVRFLWTVTDPADAQEALVARGLLPEGWCGDVRRGWHERQARDDGWGEWRDVVLPAPRTVHNLMAVASLGVPAILRAEMLAHDACAALREYGCPRPERVVWQVGERRRRRGQWVPIAWTAPSGSIPAFSDVFSVEGSWFPEHGPEVPIPSAVALWEMGLALDAITADAVRIVVPTVGGAS